MNDNQHLNAQSSADKKPKNNEGQKKMSSKLKSNTLDTASNLAQKMLLVMNEVSYMQKNGVNAFLKYHYITDADVMAQFSEAFRKHGIFMFSSMLERQSQTYKTRAGKEGFIVTAKIEVRFIDVETGQELRGVFFGDGADSDDKAVYKAITGAIKYALLKTFLVATGDDPENDNSVSQSVGQKEYRNTALIERKNIQQTYHRLCETAKKGTNALRSEWDKLSMDEKRELKEGLANLKQLASNADKALQVNITTTTH